MKVISSTEKTVKFDNGLVLSYSHNQDCCEHNYLDFEQMTVGREFKTMNAGQFVEAITIKEDGFFVKDKNKIPTWIQARSEQNGYYYNGVNLVVTHENITLIPKKPDSNKYNEMFNGTEEG